MYIQSRHGSITIHCVGSTMNTIVIMYVSLAYDLTFWERVRGKDVGGAVCVCV